MCVRERERERLRESRDKPTLIEVVEILERSGLHELDAVRHRGAADKVRCGEVHDVTTLATVRAQAELVQSTRSTQTVKDCDIHCEVVHLVSIS